ncbi:MAG: phosphodiester glycosidase family protein [Bulleidia sp.]|nr:phosphodiester glycosidase family protein [Bulleidia sp.]
MKKSRFKVIWAVCLCCAFTLVLLDAFVIPHGTIAVVKAEETAEETAQASAETESATVNGEYTQTGYSSDDIQISYTTQRVNDTTVYVVDVQVSDPSLLKTAFADDTYGRNVKETTSDIAEANDAILAINGDYYGFRDSGYVIRNGVLYRSEGSGNEDLVIDAEGNFSLINEDDISAQELLEQGAVQVFSFGPGLVNDGEICVSENEEVAQSMTSNPRTAIGMVEPGHYILVVSEGRTDDSEGLTLYQLAQVMKDNGCSVAYNLDGGGSSTLWFNGQVINQTVGGRGSSERKVSDIVYVSESSDV